MSDIKCVNEHADAKRLIDWLSDPHHKPANLAFTEGPERQVAYALATVKQEWNKRCNEACQRQVLKQVNAAYEHAAKIAELESFLAARQIRALKHTL